MNLVHIGTYKIPVDRCCDKCSGPYPDVAIKELGEIHVYHQECVCYLVPVPAEVEEHGVQARQLNLFGEAT